MSSAAAQALKNYRFMRGGSTTPVPVWNTQNLNSQTAATTNSTSSSVSARKLANALWEFNNDPPPPCKAVTKAPGRSKSASRRTRMLLLTYDKDDVGDRASDLDIKDTALMEKAHLRCCSHRSPNMRSKNYYKELHNGLITSKELLKILVRFCGIREQKSTVVSLASALYTELDQVRVNVDQIFKEQRYGCTDMICHNSQYWREKEIERTKIASQSILEELSTERRHRRRAERLNKRLGSELAQMKNLLIKTTKELENERKTREIIEKVCSEMVKDIGQDKAAVEEMKRESAKVLEDLEEERQMLQLADEWREERIHMKLSEAKFQFEEKNAAVDKLRNELELFLTAKMNRETDQERDVKNMENEDQNQHIYPIINSLLTNSFANGSEKDEEEGLNDDIETDSEDSDLHSIELSMDSNNKGFVWSYAAGNIEHIDELDIDQEKNEDINNCFDRVSRNFSGESGLTDEIEGYFHGGQQDFGGKLFEEVIDDNKLIDHKDQKLVHDEEPYESINEPTDGTLADSKIVLPRGLPSPIRQWEKLQASKCKGQQQGEGSKIAELMKAIRESESKATLVRSRNEVHHQSQIGPIA